MSNARKDTSVFVEALNVPITMFRRVDMQAVIDLALMNMTASRRTLDVDAESEVEDSDDEFPTPVEPLLRG